MEITLVSCEHSRGINQIQLTSLTSASLVQDLINTSFCNSIFKPLHCYICYAILDYLHFCRIELFNIYCEYQTNTFYWSDFTPVSTCLHGCTSLHFVTSFFVPIFSPSSHFSYSIWHCSLQARHLAELLLWYFIPTLMSHIRLLTPISTI